MDLMGMSFWGLWWLERRPAAKIRSPESGNGATWSAARRFMLSIWLCGKNETNGGVRVTALLVTGR